jgi:hypothetical protein
VAYTVPSSPIAANFHQLSTDEDDLEEDRNFETQLNEHPNKYSQDYHGPYHSYVEVESSDDEDFCREEDVDPEDNDLQSLLRSWAIADNVSGSTCKRLLRVLRLFHPDLPKDPRTLKGTKPKLPIRKICGGTFYHFGIKSGLEAVLASLEHLPLDDTISLQISIDGLPVFKSSGAQFWPILGFVKGSKSSPFVISLFCGEGKPTDTEDFFEDFIGDANDLIASGFKYWNRHFQCIISAFVCDAPARSFVKKVKQFNGYSGCEKCTQVGVFVQDQDGKRMTFPETSAPNRTDESFLRKSDPEHHLGESPLLSINGLGMVSQFPLDYMHLVCLGVMRRLVFFWCDGPLRTRLSIRDRQEISDHLVSLKKCQPLEFNRQPRSLSERSRWKATEWRQFLLYTGPVVLREVLPLEMYNNFMLLSASISLLSNPAIAQLCADHAKELLIIFVNDFASLYGEGQIIYNLHNLIHLADDVKLHGHLDSFSAFPFENFLGFLKKLIRKKHQLIEQVARRILERTSLILEQPQVKSVWSNKIQLEMEHFEGPLEPVHEHSGRRYKLQQYKKLTFDHGIDCMVTVKTSKGDNCVKIGNEVSLIVNIISSDGEVFIVYNIFTCVEPFFTYPFNSSKTGVYRVSSQSTQMLVAHYTEIQSKFALLPSHVLTEGNDPTEYVALPLLHMSQ